MNLLGTTERQLQTLRMLSSRTSGVTVEELAAQFGVSVKTARRDLNRLRDAGFPVSVQTESHGRGRWTIMGESFTGTGLSFDEAFALILATQTIGSFAGTAVGEAARSAVSKLRSGLSESVLAYCDRLARSIALIQTRQVDYTDKAEILETILLGHEECVNVFIAYQSRQSTEPVSYPISPYAIRQYQNSVYVIGHSEQHDAIAESQWHASQETHRHTDGSLTLTLNCAVTPDLESWISSIGPDAKVISPESLADAIAQKVTAIAAIYQPEPKHEP